MCRAAPCRCPQSDPEMMYVHFEKRLSVLSDDCEGAPLPAPVELAGPTSKGLWEKFSNYSLRFYLTLACNRYGNDHSTRPKDRPAGRAAVPRGVAAARESVKVLEAQTEILFCASLQYNLAAYLRDVGPPDSLQHPSSSVTRRDDQELRGKGGRELRRSHLRTPR